MTEAEETYRAHLGSGHPDIYLDLAALLKEAGREEEAEAVYREAIRRDLHDALLPLANMLSGQTGRKEEAETLYREAIAHGEAWGHLNLATLLSDLGRRAEAEVEFKTALASDDPLAARGYGIFLHEQGRLAEGETMLRQALRAGDEEAHIDLGNVLADLGHMDDAEKHYLRAIAAGAALPIAHGAYAVLLEEVGRDSEAAQQRHLAGRADARGSRS